MQLHWLTKGQEDEMVDGIISYMKLFHTLTRRILNCFHFTVYQRIGVLAKTWQKELRTTGDLINHGLEFV